MSSFRYLGGDQQPDLYGVLTVGDVLELPQRPAWGEWEPTSSKATGPSPTPQPAYEPVEAAEDVPAPAAAPEPAPTEQEG